MPTFGDYETVGEPLAVINLQGHVSTVSKARKIGAPGNREFVVKCYTPYHQPKQDAAQESLHRDHGLEFLEGIKQLKKVQGPGARCLLPIHDLGISPEGVWYITDFYPRGSLLTLIGRRAKVDSTGLKQIVRSILAGCLALKKSRGFPHGNLKPGNVFLVGKPQPLPKTPMIVADPFPAAPLQLARLGGQDRQTVDELLHQVTEVQDLHALGEIILQLVERRVVRSGYDYNYPIARSDAWDNLGKDGERWRQVCNRLLDPQLSLAETNLESFAKDYPAPADGKKLAVIIAAILAVCLVGGGIYGTTVWNTKRHEQNCHLYTETASQALQGNDLIAARKDILSALRWEPHDNAASDLRQTIERAIDKQYSVMLTSAQENFRSTHWDEALNQLNEALILKPDQPDATDLKAQIEAAKNAAVSREAQQKHYQSTMESGLAAYDQGDYTAAVAAADQALAVAKDDSKALQLKNAAQAKLNQQASVAQQYHSAMQSGSTAYDRGDYATAMEDADQALAVAKDDSKALQLKNAAQTKLDQKASLAQQYQSALQSGSAAYDRGDYATAIQEADLAMTVVKGDAKALQLKNAAQAKLDQKQSMAQQYRSAMQIGQAAYDKGDYTTALQSATQALSLYSGDPKATQLKNAAQARLDEQARLAQQYVAAMQSGQAAYDKGDYTTALQSATQALSLYSGDPKATQLKNAAQARLDEQARLAQHYVAAMQSGQAAYDKGDYTTALQAANQALSFYNGDPKALQLKNSAQAKLDEQARQAEQYASAMQNGQAAYDKGDYATALQQANQALRYFSSDAKALQLKNSAQAKLDEQARQAEQYASAMQSGQAAYDKGDYTTALQQANQALRYSSGDAKATQLKNSAQAKLDDQARLLQQYQEAMKSGQAAYDKGDYTTALQEAGLAISASPGDAKALQLKSSAQANIDFQSATSFFGACDYGHALEECAKHPGDNKFQNLQQSIVNEQQALENAGTKFARGDYSFMAEVDSYKNKSKFADLLAQAKPEAEVFNQLKLLSKDLNNRSKVVDILKNPSYAGFITKTGFNQFNDWLSQTDPVVPLNRQLKLFQIWFGIAKPDPAIIDANTGVKAVKLQPGISVEAYYPALDKLADSYKALEGTGSTHLKDIRKIEDAMNSW